MALAGALVSRYRRTGGRGPAWKAAVQAVLTVMMVVGLGLVELADDTYLATLTHGPSSVVELTPAWEAVFGLPNDGT